MIAHELRLGNYIEYTDDSRECIIKEIDGHGCVVLFEDDGVETWIELLQLSPIAITHDWLLKLGFEPNGSYYQIAGLNIWKFNDMYICDKNGTVLYTIHQLQNLFFALTGEELTIK